MYFQKETVLSEDIAEKPGRLFGRGIFAFGQQLRHFALQAPGERYQSFAVLGKKFLADTRLVIKTAQRSLGGDFDQIAIAFIVLHQHRQVVIGVTFGWRAMIVFLADVEFATQDRLDPCCFGEVIKIRRAEYISVIGYRDRGHLQLLGTGH